MLAPSSVGLLSSWSCFVLRASFPLLFSVICLVPTFPCVFLVSKGAAARPKFRTFRSPVLSFILLFSPRPTLVFAELPRAPDGVQSRRLQNPSSLKGLRPCVAFAIRRMPPAGTLILYLDVSPPFFFLSASPLRTAKSCAGQGGCMTPLVQQ